MKKILNEELLSTREITSLGRVNQVLGIKGASGKHIARLNTAPEKRIEYRNMVSRRSTCPTCFTTWARTAGRKITGKRCGIRWS